MFQIDQCIELSHFQGKHLKPDQNFLFQLFLNARKPVRKLNSVQFPTDFQIDEGYSDEKTDLLNENTKPFDNKTKRSSVFDIYAENMKKRLFNLM
jgi:hypothetical protein